MKKSALVFVFVLCYVLEFCASNAAAKQGEKAEGRYPGSECNTVSRRSDTSPKAMATSQVEPRDNQGDLGFGIADCRFGILRGRESEIRNPKSQQGDVSCSFVDITERKIGDATAALSMQVSPAEVVLGEAVTIYGSLTDPGGKGLAGRQVLIAVQPPEESPAFFYATTYRNGDYVLIVASASAGKGWEVTASWSGDETYDGVTSPPAFFDVLPADTRVNIASSAYSILLSETMDVFGRLKATTQLPDEFDLLSGQEIQLHILGPQDDTPTVLSTKTDADGVYTFPDLKPRLGGAGIWKLWVKFGGSPDLKPSSSRTINVRVTERAGHAILVAGKGEDNTRVEFHNRTCDTIYHRLTERGFQPDDILYLRFGVPDDDSIVVDGQPSVDAIKQAITTWAKDKMTAAPGPLFIVFVGSGEKRLFSVSGKNEGVGPRALDDWITSLEKSLSSPPIERPITFIYGGPHSGSFIRPLSSEEDLRVIITSSDANELPVTGPEEDAIARQGDFFVLDLFENLSQGRNLKRSFERAAGATLTYTRNDDGNGLNVGLAYPDLGAHHPLLDDNGDGIGSFGFLSERPGDDGFLSSHIFLGYGEPKPKAQIVEVSPEQLISPGEQPDLWAKVNDRNRVEAVWMVIKPPFFSMGKIDQAPSIHRDVEAVRLPLFDPEGDGIYSRTNYPEFSEMGTYQVLFFVKDKYTGELGEIWKTKVVVLNEDAPDPGEFSILSPEDGEAVGLQVLLTWSASQEMAPNDEITYRVQIATDPSFTDVVFEQRDIGGISLLVGEDAGLLDRTTYFWRVRAESFFGKVRFAASTLVGGPDAGEPLERSTGYEPLAEYSSFNTNQGAGIPPYNVLTVLVYNQNDPSQSPPGTTIEISPFVGTINNWMYSGYVPVGTYTIDVSAPSFSPEHRETEVTSESAATEVFTLVPNAGSVSGEVISANTSSNIRGATVQLEVTSGIYLGTTLDTVTGADGGFDFTALHSAINYQITVSKTYYNDYQAPFSLGAGEAKDLGTVSIAFTDDDGDGLPDEFELIIVDADPDDDINSIEDVLPEDDFDGDNKTNEDEYLAATDPTSDSSYLRIVNISGNTPNAFTVTWTSVSGILYSVYYSDTIGGWSLGASHIPASGTGENSWTDDDVSGTIPPPGEADMRFYRVEAY